MTTAEPEPTVTRSIPGRSWESSQVIKHLQDKPAGYLATYEELSGIIRRRVPEDGRNYVLSAIRFLERDGQVWRCETNSGYRRLDDGEIVEEGVRGLGILRRKSRRVGRVVSVADRANLSPEQVATQDRVILSQRTVELFLSPKGQKRLGGIVADSQGKALPPVEDAVALFK